MKHKEDSGIQTEIMPIIYRFNDETPEFSDLLAVKEGKIMGIIEERQIIEEKGFKHYETLVENFKNSGYEIDSLSFFIDEIFFEGERCIRVENPSNFDFICDECLINDIKTYAYRDNNGNTNCWHKLMEKIHQNNEYSLY